MYVTYKNLEIHLNLVAMASRDAIVACFHQIFDELGLAIHKEDTASLIHWDGGRVLKVLNLVSSIPQRGYWIGFRSLGDASATKVEIHVKLGYDLWLHPKAKTQEKLDRFASKLEAVSRERKITYITPDDWARRT